MPRRRLRLLRYCALGLSALTLAACGGTSAQPRPVEPRRFDVINKAKTSGSGARRLTARRRIRSSPRGILRRDLDRVLEAGPGALLQRVPLQPIFGARHRFLGFRVISVFENRPSALRYGVRPGDLVLRVNGQQLLTPAHLLQVFRLLRNASHLEVDVVRDSKPVKIRVPIIDPAIEKVSKDSIGWWLKDSLVKTCSVSANVSTLAHSIAFVSFTGAHLETQTAPSSRFSESGPQYTFDRQV